MFRCTLLRAAVVACMGFSAAHAATLDGGKLYKERCATCHEQTSVERMPSRDALRQFAPEHLIGAMTTGLMQEQARGLSAEEIRAIAQFVSVKPFGEMQAATPLPNLCTQKPAALTLEGSQWNGWGRDLENTRLQPQPGLSASDIPRLKVKWVYAYPGRPFKAVNGITASGGNIDGGGATVADGRVFVNSGYGSWSGGSGRLLLVFSVDGK